MLALLFLISLVLASGSYEFPKITDKDFDSRNLFFPTEVTQDQLKQEIADLYRLSSSVLLAYLSTKGKIYAQDPYVILNDVRGTKTAFVWMSIHNRLTDLQTNGLNLESILCLYSMITYYPLSFLIPVYRKGKLKSYEVRKIEFSPALDIGTESGPEVIQAHVASILEKLGVFLLTNHASNAKLDFLHRIYFKTLRILHYGNILFTSIDIRLLHRGLVAQELVAMTFDREADFSTIFKPITVKLRLLNEILFRENLNLNDPDHLAGELLDSFADWECWFDDLTRERIVAAYITPFKEARKREAQRSIAMANVLLSTEKEKSGRHVSRELARIRKTIVEEEEEMEEFEVKEENVAPAFEGSRFDEFSDALSFTVKIILAQHYREAYLLPIMDQLEYDFEDDGSWIAFAADFHVQEKAMQLFNLSPAQLMEMASWVTERNELVHRRPYPPVLKLRSKWNILFRSLSHDAMDIVDYAGIKIAHDDSGLFDNIQPCLKTAFVETTYAVLNLLLVCEKLNYPESIKEQCGRLAEYRNGYAHPDLSKYQRLIPHLMKMQ